MQPNEYQPLQLPYRPADGFPEEKEDLGEIVLANLVCPGVYFIETAKSDKYEYGAEWVLVLPDSPAVPPKARAYGRPLPSCPDVVLFPFQSGYSWFIIQYEIHKYQTENGIRQPAYMLCAELADGMRYRPEYFGTFTPPDVTPWGPTLRSKAIENGVFGIQTAEMKLGLAVCYPIAQDFDKATLRYAVLTDFDQQIGIRKTCGYYFFPSETLYMPLWNLGAVIPECWPKIRGYHPVLCSSILESSPAFAERFDLGKIDFPDPFDDLLDGEGAPAVGNGV